ncbi:MazG nucleotide pyrophosphohydrolase domain-containing protein [Pseudoalteromonas sp. 31A1]|uniref:MazG nucleotide pyrophosphohydrolase domain-containing protein n=1 Tax=Pseudoalteromonas sp. 31A1 TaxID=2686351 RepID=UPI001980272D
MSNKFIEVQIKKLNEIAKVKVNKDLKGTWSEGSITYLNGIYDELEEVTEELNSGRQCYLEDELGDVLWDYLCMIQHLELEEKVLVNKVFDRVVKKYSERVITLEEGETWGDVKARQKTKLQSEFNETKRLKI